MDEYYFLALQKYAYLLENLGGGRKISWGKMVLEWKEKISINENKAMKMFNDSMQFCLIKEQYT